jgi:hypothetical protein
MDKLNQLLSQLETLVRARLIYDKAITEENSEAYQVLSKLHCCTESDIATKEINNKTQFHYSWLIGGYVIIVNNVIVWVN